jgi:hypothetical protein
MLFLEGIIAGKSVIPESSPTNRPPSALSREILTVCTALPSVWHYTIGFHAPQLASFALGPWDRLRRPKGSKYTTHLRIAVRSGNGSNPEISKSILSCKIVELASALINLSARITFPLLVIKRCSGADRSTKIAVGVWGTSKVDGTCVI